MCSVCFASSCIPMGLNGKVGKLTECPFQSSEHPEGTLLIRTWVGLWFFWHCIFPASLRVSGKVSRTSCLLSLSVACPTLKKYRHRCQPIQMFFNQSCLPSMPKKACPNAAVLLKHLAISCDVNSVRSLPFQR